MAQRCFKINPGDGDNPQPTSGQSPSSQPSSSSSNPSTTSSSPNQSPTFTFAVLTSGISDTSTAISSATIAPAPTSGISVTPTPTSHGSTNKVKIIIPICIVGVLVALGISSIMIFRRRRARSTAGRSPTEVGRSTRTKVQPFSLVTTHSGPEMGEHLTPPRRSLQTDPNALPQRPGLKISTTLQGSQQKTPNQMPSSKARRMNISPHQAQVATTTSQTETNSSSEAVAQPGNQESQVERHLLVALMGRFEALEGRVEAVIGTNPPGGSLASSLMELEDDRPPDYMSLPDSRDNREQRVNESRKGARS